MTVLLDGPVLAALVIAEHEQHDRASAWFAGVDAFAVCPQTEAALLRFLLRLGESPATALAVLAGIREHPACEFWPDDLSHTALDPSLLGGADQFGRTYLEALAAAHSADLATLDAIHAS